LDKKTELAAIAGAVATVATALIAALAGLGEHAPGVVAGTCFAAVVLALYVSREAEIRERAAAREKIMADLVDKCKECKEEQAAKDEATLTRVLDRFEQSTRIDEQKMARDSTDRRLNQIEKMINQSRKGQNDGNA
jgi:hypothetical protein